LEKRKWLENQQFPTGKLVLDKPQYCANLFDNGILDAKPNEEDGDLWQF
jgi:hypothetical protein